MRIRAKIVPIRSARAAVLFANIVWQVMSILKKLVEYYKSWLADFVILFPELNLGFQSQRLRHFYLLAIVSAVLSVS